MLRVNGVGIEAFGGKGLLEAAELVHVVGRFPTEALDQFALHYARELWQEAGTYENVLVLLHLRQVTETT